MTLQDFRKLMKPTEDGVSIHGQKFTNDEALRILDFFSFMDGLGIWENAEMASLVIAEVNDIGARVAFVMCGDVDILASVIAGENDDRVLAIMNQRMADED